MPSTIRNKIFISVNTWHGQLISFYVRLPLIFMNFWTYYRFNIVNFDVVYLFIMVLNHIFASINTFFRNSNDFLFQTCWKWSSCLFIFNLPKMIIHVQFTHPSCITSKITNIYPKKIFMQPVAIIATQNAINNFFNINYSYVL